jgi:rhodanese-related sulfurtransferase
MNKQEKGVNKMSMNKMIGILIIGGMLITAGCCTMTGKKGSCGGACGKVPAAKAETVGSADISTAGLKALLDSKTPLALFDARTGKYDDGKRIPGAGSLSPEATAEEVGKLISGKDVLIVTYCANLHCPASAKLAAHLRELGYRNILEYSAGIAGWIEAGNKVETAVK